jgi:hypothetical protein
VESHLFLFELLRGHEPGRVGRARQLPQRDRRELWCHRMPGGETGSVDGLLPRLASTGLEPVYPVGKVCPFKNVCGRERPRP